MCTALVEKAHRMSPDKLAPAHSLSSQSQAPWEARLIELETRIAFLEHGLAELNQALADTHLQGSRNTELLHHMLKDLGKLRTELHSSNAAFEPPPHY